MDLEQQIKQSFFNLLPYEQEPNAISVSSLPWCLRRLFFTLKFNARPTPNPDMIAGKIHHVVIRYLDFFDEGALFELRLSKPLKDGYSLVGHADVIDIYDTVWELKFTKRLNSQELDPLYFAQANAYAVMGGYERFILAKVHRYSYDVKILEGEADEDAFEALEQRAMNIIDCLKSNTIPQGPELDWECKNCVYNVVCSNLKVEQ